MLNQPEPRRLAVLFFPRMSEMAGQPFRGLPTARSKTAQQGAEARVLVDTDAATRFAHLLGFKL